MTGAQYVQLLRNHWKQLLAFLGAGLMLAAIAVLVIPSKYAASVDTYVLSASATPDATASYQGGLLSEQRVKSYVQLFQNGRIADAVVNTMKLPETPEELNREVSVSTQADTVVLSIVVTDQIPQRAIAIANASAEALVGIVAQLEQPANRLVAPATTVKIVAPARLSDGPVSPNVVLYLMAGGVVGLMIGLGVSLAIDKRGRPIRSLDDLKTTVPGYQLLGITLQSSYKDAAGLSILSDDRSPESEAYKQIRINLEFVDVDSPGRVLLLTSALPGEGKTTTACNVAAALSSAGHKVVLVDADLRRAGAAEVLNLSADVGLTSVLARKAAWHDCLQRHPLGGFDFMATGPLPPNPAELASSASLAHLFSVLRSSYEYVIVDSAPLLPVADSAGLSYACDGVVLLAKYGSTRDTELLAALSNLDAVRARVFGLVFTFASVRSSGLSARRAYGGYGDDAASGRAIREWVDSDATTSRVAPREYVHQQPNGKVQADSQTKGELPSPHPRPKR